MNAIIVMAYSLPIVSILSFCIGALLVKNIYTAKEKQPVAKLNSLKKTSKDTMQEMSKLETEQEKKARLYRENIENFGTFLPQKEV